MRKLSLALLILLSSCTMGELSTYDKQASFTMPTNIVTDIDGNVYHTITVGTQVWTVENLKTTRYNDGTPIPSVSSNAMWDTLYTPGYCQYNKNTLYNWYAVNTGKLAPAGWHVPTDAEWTTLANYLTAKSIAAISGWRTSTILGAIGKDTLQNNSSGFTAFPCGYRDLGGTFIDAGFQAVWWTASENIYAYAGCVTLYYNYDYMGKYYLTKSYGFSVRCIQN